MEILDKASHHPKQFTCGECGCTFVVDKNKDKRRWRDNGNWVYYVCPECHRALVDRDEALKEYELRIKIVESDATEEEQRKASRWWNRRKEGK